MTFDDKMRQSTSHDARMGQEAANRMTHLPQQRGCRSVKSSISACSCQASEGNAFATFSVVHKGFHLRCDTEYSAHLIFVKFHQSFRKKNIPLFAVTCQPCAFAAQPVNSHPFRQGRRERQSQNERAASTCVVLTLLLFCRNRHHYLHCQSRDTVGDILVDPQCVPKEYEGFKENK